MDDLDIIRTIREKSKKYEASKDKISKEINLLDLMNFLSGIPQFLKTNPQYADTLLLQLEYFNFNYGTDTRIDIEYWTNFFKDFITI